MSRVSRPCSHVNLLKSSFSAGKFTLRYFRWVLVATSRGLSQGYLASFLAQRRDRLWIYLTEIKFRQSYFVLDDPISTCFLKLTFLPLMFNLCNIFLIWVEKISFFWSLWREDLVLPVIIRCIILLKYSQIVFHKNFLLYYNFVNIICEYRCVYIYIYDRIYLL